jgi:16S rRNA (cytosine967-C5)-methyltransferase
MLSASFSASTPAGRRYVSYLQTADTLVNQYTGSEPLAAYLKKYFAANKKHGGSDRKYISTLCYGFFRLGNFGIDWPEAVRWQTVLFLYPPAEIMARELLPESWLVHLVDPLFDKFSCLATMGLSGDWQSIFPFIHLLSANIIVNDFVASHLRQPDLFLRVRPGKWPQVEKKLQAAGIEFHKVATDALSIRNATSIEQVLKIDEEVVIQDLSSQRVAELFHPIPVDAKKPLMVWDACAASGGKSILAKDYFGSIRLTVSDVRATVLHNLEKRFAKAGINTYDQRVVDLSKAGFALPPQQLVICDVPCSGSGTWGRTPEQIRFFTEEKLAEYNQRQRAILTQVAPTVAENGYLLYITCSVFRSENEAMVSWLQQGFPFRLVESKLLEGYQHRADTLYAALLQKVS